MFRECLACKNASWYIICETCELSMQRYNKCAFCSGFCSCNYTSYALFPYSNVRNLILRLKYNFEDSIGDAFAYLASKFLTLPSDLVWTCIPTTDSKIVQRGYNASLVLGVSFQKVFGGTMNPFILSKETNSSNRESFIQRFSKAFDMRIDNISIDNSKTICIIDDVIASGSTMKRAIELLEQQNIKNIICIAIGKV